MIMPVFTAHPTEAKRRLVLLKLGAPHRRAGRPTSATPRRGGAGRARPCARRSSPSGRATRRAPAPTVLDEVRGGLYHFERTLFELAPEFARKLERALAREYAGAPSRRSSCASGAGWAATATATPTSRWRRPRRRCASTRGSRCASACARWTSAARPPHLHRAAGRAAGAGREPGARRPGVPERSAGRASATRTNPIGRSWRCVTAGSAPARGGRGALARRPRPRPGTYRGVDGFLEDLRLVEESLRAHRGQRLAEGRLGTLMPQADIFGFHLATLDLRQHSRAAPGRWPRCSRARGCASD